MRGNPTCNRFLKVVIFKYVGMGSDIKFMVYCFRYIYMPIYLWKDLNQLRHYKRVSNNSKI